MTHLYIYRGQLILQFLKENCGSISNSVYHTCFAMYSLQNKAFGVQCCRIWSSNEVSSQGVPMLCCGSFLFQFEYHETQCLFINHAHVQLEVFHALCMSNALHKYVHYLILQLLQQILERCESIALKSFTQNKRKIRKIFIFRREADETQQEVLNQEIISGISLIEGCK